MNDRFDRIEDQLRQDIKEIRKDVAEIKESLAVINSKQKIAFNFGAWIINTLITVIIAVMTMTFSGNFFKK